MPPTMTRSIPPQASLRSGRTIATWIAAGAAALLVAVAAGEVLAAPETVDVAVINSADRAVMVVVSDGSGLRLPLATVEPGEERLVELVIDQGPEWRVTYLAAGEVAAEQTLTRAELAGRGFRLTVPAEVSVAPGVDG